MKQIELLLLENVDNVGIVGDVVKVKPGFARNFLVPCGLATPPTAGAIKRLAAKRTEMEARIKVERQQQEQLIERLQEVELTLQRSANDQGILYGGVSQHDIAELLRAEGFAVEDRFVRIGQQIKRLDSYPIPIVIHKELRTEIKLWVVSDRPPGELDASEATEGESPQEVVADLEEE